MTATNYHLIDFMDFDPSLRRDESLWKAYAPSRVEERDGDILITLPYQRQLRQPDMAADERAPQQEYVLTVRAYSPNILRLFTSMAGDAMVEEDDMLLFAPEVQRVPLALQPLGQGREGFSIVLGSPDVPVRLFADETSALPRTDETATLTGRTGTTALPRTDATATLPKVVGIIDLTPPVLDHWSDLLPAPQPAPVITFFPDGDHSKPVALSDDHFSPPRYDALPLGFVEAEAPKAPLSPPEGGTIDETSKVKTIVAPSGAEGGASRASSSRATISFRCTADECFVGTGERFRKMDLSGSTFFLKNQDGQGVNNSRCYKNIPFYLSSRGYGAFFHTSDYCKLDLANHSTRSVQFLNHRATIDVFLIGGATPEEILRGYRMLTGFPQMPPLWSFGIWMSRMTYFSADEVEAICQRLRREHYPCDVIHLDTGWFRTDWLCEWRFNPERFPDPEAFIRRLAAQGFKVSLWQLPYISEKAEQYEEAKTNNYISIPKAPEAPPSAPEGATIVLPLEVSSIVPPSGGEGGAFPSGAEGGASSNFSSLDYAGTIDFTNPAAVRWYQEQLLGPLLRMGVKCIKTDFGENIHMDHTYHAMTAERLNNLYALLYQRAAWKSLPPSRPSPGRPSPQPLPVGRGVYTSSIESVMTSSETDEYSMTAGETAENSMTAGETAENSRVKTNYSPPSQGGAGGGSAGGGSLLWSRSAWAGCQRYPVHWGGDSESSWDGMAGSLKGGLHLGLSGFAFWSHDVPGFHSTPDFMNSPIDPTVYVRWTQFGVFTSHIRYHGTCKREPWHYPEIAPIVKRWWRLRYRLIPYIIEQSRKACTSGLPVLQALLIKHPDDRQAWHIDDEYYFGDEFLVCPVMNSEGRRDIYLPGRPSPQPLPVGRGVYTSSIESSMTSSETAENSMTISETAENSKTISETAENSMTISETAENSMTISETAENSRVKTNYSPPSQGGAGGGSAGGGSAGGGSSSWVNFFTGERLEGGRWYYGVETPMELMPVFVREGARIPLYPEDVDSTDDMDLRKATILEITKDFKGIQ